MAEFVTQANFLPALRREEVWETEVGAFELTNNNVFRGEIDSLDEFDRLELMIRQEDLILKVDNEGCVVIRDRQFLGREFRYCLQTESGKELIARTTSQVALPIGVQVKVSIAEDNLRVFPAIAEEKYGKSSELVGSKNF